MSQDTTTRPSLHADLEPVHLHELFKDVVQSATAALPPDVAKRFSQITVTIPENLPELRLNKAQTRSFVLLFVLAGIQNMRDGSHAEISAKANRQTVDVTMTLTPSPMFVLLTRGTRDSIEKSLDVSTLSNASDPYISFHAARMLGSEIQANTWVETIPPDKAVIHAYFPLYPPAIGKKASKRKVLVIEDNRQISMLLELYLKHEGFETHAAANGLRGLDTAKQLRPDLITLDVMMPEMDGWQALRELKSAEETCDIPVIVISVLRDVQIGFEFGASGYLTKPVNRNDLVLAVQHLTAKPLQYTIPGKGAYETITIFPDSTALKDAAAAATGATSVTVAESSMKIGDAKAITDGVRPDGVLFDADEDPMGALHAANRLRVYSSFDDIPIIALADGTVQAFLTDYGAGIFSAVTTKNGLPALFG